MVFRHLTQEFTIDYDWWLEAGMEGFVPASPSYGSDCETFRQWPVELVALDDVEPLDRKLSHGVFNDSPSFGTARDRVVNILSGILVASKMPPVELMRLNGNAVHKFRLKHGAHRFYCSRAAGFTHIPAVVYPFSEVQYF